MFDFTEIQLDRTSPVPLFYQLAEALRSLIDSADTSESKMPSERKLASLLDLDRSTVSKAYAELLKSGLLVKSSPRILQIAKRGKQRQITPPQCIGVIIPDKLNNIVPDNFNIIMEYFKGFFDAASENNISLSMIRLPEANSRNAANTGFIRELSHQVIGIIHLGERYFSLDSPLKKLMQNKSLPQAIIAAETEYEHILQVIPDLRPGAEQLAARLKELNIRKVGFPMTLAFVDTVGVHPYFNYTSLRREAFMREFFIEEGFVCDKAWEMPDCDSYDGVLEYLRNKRAENDLPQVYCCHNDLFASWMQKACAELGISVPGELSIVGFDKMDSVPREGLATIRHPFYEIGVAAVNGLLEIYRKGAGSKSNIIKLATNFINGKTLGKPYNQNKEVFL